MWLAVKGNVRSANAALTSFKDAMELAFKAGGVSGMFTVGLGLMGATVIFLIYQQDAMKVLVGFGFGGSLAALFMRVGGGIFTKAADVGGDLVGKIEAGIPEDDPRNAATIADNVGDNVGDCAGMAADVFESYEVTLVAAIILAAYALEDPSFVAAYGGIAGASAFAMKLIIFALILRAVGVFSSILGIMAVKVPAGSEMRDPMRPINAGYYTSSLTSVVGFFIVNYFYMTDPRTGAPDWRFGITATLGIVLSIVTLLLTNYFTHPDKGPVTETANAARTGPATLILSGLGEGLESSVWALMVIVVVIIGAVVIFRESTALQFYGIALTGLGLLTTTGFILAMDTYGPITDNAHGIFEMGGVHQEEASRTLSWMDAIGNTTKALTKGLAIATAVIAAVSLFRSFIDEAHLGSIGVQINMPDGLRRPADRRRGAVPVQLVRNQGGRPRGLPGRVRGAPPVPRASGNHGRQRASRLRQRRRYRHGDRPEGTDEPRDSRGLRSAAGGLRPRRGRARRLPRRHDPDWAVACGLHVKLRAPTGTTPRRRSRTAFSAARAPTCIRRPSSATPSAIHSRIRPARRSTR